MYIFQKPTLPARLKASAILVLCALSVHSACVSKVLALEYEYCELTHNGLFAVANDINQAGEVIGAVYNTDKNAFLWSGDESFQLSDQISEGFSLNDNGEAALEIADEDGYSEAHYWSEISGALNISVSAGAPTRAIAINGAGQIAFGYHPFYWDGNQSPSINWVSGGQVFDISDSGIQSNPPSFPSETSGR